MPIGTGGVIDYVNTTSGVARGVTAENGVSGAGSIVAYNPTPGQFRYITTQVNGDNIAAEDSRLLITQT